MTSEFMEGQVPRAREPSLVSRGRFVARAEAFGFLPPPAPLRLKILHAPPLWTVFIQAAQDVPVARIVDWLPLEGLLRLEFGSRRVVRADYERLPEGWGETFQGVRLDDAHLDAAGEAAVTLVGSHAAIAAFARRIRGSPAKLALVDLHADRPTRTFLTPPQDEALRTAVAAGYYRIPRAVNLIELAKRMGISSGSLSERLRRAEARIITRYVEAGSASPWDERTVFDDAPPAFPSPTWPDASSASKEKDA